MSKSLVSPSKALAVSGVGVRRIVANILSTYAQATEADKVNGAQWYGEANQIASDLAVAHGVSIECAAAVIAHLSPRIHWSRNVTGAGIVLSGAEAKGFMSRSVNAAKGAIASDDPLSTLNGNKVKAFAANILGDENAVTIDVWILRVVGVDEKYIKRKGVYEAIGYCFQRASTTLGISPAVLQAVCWIVARNGKAT